VPAAVNADESGLIIAGAESRGERGFKSNIRTHPKFLWLDTCAGGGYNLAASNILNRRITTWS
jgi:hypothetical protein